MSKQPTMAELRAECAKLGITPGRSIEATLKRIEDRRAAGSTIGTAINAAFKEACAEIEKPKPDIRPIDAIALQTNWRRMQVAKERMAAPCHHRLPLLASTALSTREGLWTFTPIFRGVPKKSFDDIAAELQAMMPGHSR